MRFTALQSKAGARAVTVDRVHAVRVLQDAGYRLPDVKRYLATADETPSGMWPVGQVDRIMALGSAQRRYRISYKNR